MVVPAAGPPAVEAADGGSTKMQQQRQTTRHLEDGTRVAGPQQGNMQSHTSICVSGEAARAERRESTQAAAIQNSGSHPIGIARRSDF